MKQHIGNAYFYFAIIMLLVGVAPAHGQFKFFQSGVAVSVIDANGDPVEGANVKPMSWSGKWTVLERFQGKTDSKGELCNRVIPTQILLHRSQQPFTRKLVQHRSQIVERLSR